MYGNRRRSTIILAALSFLAIAGKLSAITVTLDFNETLSESPAFDPVMPGNQPPAGLRSLMEYADAYYTDIFQDFHSLKINYWYEDLSDNTIGFNSIVATDIPGDPARRVIEANIRIDTRVGTGGSLRNYFIDPTPANDSEFEMQQTLWRDVATEDRDSWYNNFGSSIPNTFEVGYRGDAVSGGAADGATDMLSVVLHEFGHSLGVPDLNPMAQDDLDYDFNSNFVFGQSLAAVVAAADNKGHLLDPHAIMNPSIGSSRRERPSHTDFFAMASGNDYFSLDVPRREYYGGSSWNTDGNWSGDTVPGSLDDTFVRDGHSATLTTSNGFAANLFIQEGAVVNTSVNTLNVGGKITVEGVDPGSQANLVVNSSGRVTAGEIELNEGGLLTVTGGGASVPVDADEIDINAGGVMLGNGSVQINTLLRNDGTITAIAGASDELALLTGPVDLDGLQGDGEIFAVLGNLRISANTTDAFDGRMTIGAGHQVQVFGSSWEVGQNALSDAEVVLQGGGVTDPARLIKTIGSVTFNGGTLDVSGRGIVEGTAIFESGAHTQVQTGARLTFSNWVRFRGGSHTGRGELQFEDVVQVEADTTISVATVDLDGTAGTTQINFEDAVLTLDVNRLDLTNNRFDGTLQLTGQNAGLAVLLPSASNSWQMNGTLNTTGGTGIIPQTTLQGNPVIVSGTMNMDGLSTISAPMTVRGSITTADAATDIRLSGGPHVIENTASITGPGELRVGATAHLLVEDGASIDVDIVTGGRFEPGLSTGTVTADQDFAQTSIGTLAMEIAADPFVDQDLLLVNGTATVDGELEVSAIGGFVPTIGSIYTLVSAPSVTGVFDTLTTLSDSIFKFDATLLYNATTVRMAIQNVFMFGDFNDDMLLDCQDVDALVAEIATAGMGAEFDLNGDMVVDTGDLDVWLTEAGEFNVGGAYLPGDANLDGTVDGQDFIVWNTNKFSSIAAWCSGDFTADGSVDGQDFIAWNTHKFMSSDVSFAAAVPEPGGLYQLLSLIGVAILELRRRASE